MAHFARINDQNIVDMVIVVDPKNIESGEFGDPSKWIQTSYNTLAGIHYDPATREPSEDQSKALRMNYAGIGFTYDPVRDAFIPPKTYNSWVFNEDKCVWEPPIQYPEDGNHYIWVEADIKWARL